MLQFKIAFYGSTINTLLIFNFSFQSWFIVGLQIHLMLLKVAFACLSPSALVVRWALDIYDFTESEPATVQLVTDSVFAPPTFRIQGFASQISVSHPNRLPSLSVCGPIIPGQG